MTARMYYDADAESSARWHPRARLRGTSESKSPERVEGARSMGGHQ